MSSIKEKIAEVRKTVKNRSNDEIVLVLQHHDDDVERTISDFLEGKADDILTEWRHTGPARLGKTKRKKAAQRKKKAEANRDTESSKTKEIALQNGVSNRQPENSLLDTKAPPEEPHSDITLTDPQAAAVALKHLLTTGMGSGRSAEKSLNDITVPPMTPFSLPNGNVDPHYSEVGSLHPSEKHQEEVKTFKSHLHLSEHRSRTSSESSGKAHNRKKHKGPSNLLLTGHHDGSHDQSTHNQSSLSASSLHNKKSIEKASRDLQRCAVSFGRYRNLLSDEINDSYKRIKQAFEDVSNAMMDREVQLIRMLDEMKQEAFSLLDKREARAIELKKQTERVATMNQHQLNELRGEIKHFVAERKYDEELGKTTRFVFDKEVMTKIIPNFGEISAVKNAYSNKPRERLESVASDISSFSTPSVHDAPTPNDSHPTTAQSKSKTVPEKEKSSLPQKSPSWADSIESHPFQENRASWATDTPLISNNHQGNQVKDTNKPAQPEQRGKSQRQRRKRSDNPKVGGSGAEKIQSADKSDLTSEKQLPSKLNKSVKADDRELAKGSHHRNEESRENKPSSSSAPDVQQRSSRGRNRGGFRGGFRGNPRGGYRNGPPGRFERPQEMSNHFSDDKLNHPDSHAKKGDYEKPLPPRSRPRRPMRGGHSGPIHQNDPHPQNSLPAGDPGNAVVHRKYQPSAESKRVDKSNMQGSES